MKRQKQSCQTLPYEHKGLATVAGSQPKRPRLSRQLTDSAIETAIRSAYANVTSKLRPLPPAWLPDMVLTLAARGLGDSVTLSGVRGQAVMHGRDIEVWSGAPSFQEVMRYCPNSHHYDKGWILGKPFLVDGPLLYERFDCGNGHVIQQYCRAFGIPVPVKPVGHLVVKAPKRKNRVCFHFEPNGQHHEHQKQWHPHPREVYDHTLAMLAKFVAAHPEFEFFEVGQKSSNIPGVTYFPATTVSNLIEFMQTCSWFVGIMSGPMHVAVATGARCIVLINMPDASRVVLPTLRRTFTIEEEWLYPQNVHLHQEGESCLVPRLSIYSLEAAFGGDVYPFWSDRWLSLINDPEYAHG